MKDFKELLGKDVWQKIAISDLAKMWQKAFEHKGRELYEKGVTIDLTTKIRKNEQGEFEHASWVASMFVIEIWSFPYQMIMLPGAEDVPCKMFGIMYSITAEDIEDFIKENMYDYDGSGYIFCCCTSV